MSHSSTRWGYVDQVGEWSIEPRWDAAGAFSDGRAWVIRDGKVGYLDRRGELAVPLRYLGARTFSGGLAEVSETSDALLPGLTFVIDREGKRVYEARKDTVDGLTPVARWDAANGKRRWGVVSSDGEVRVPLEFDEASVNAHVIMCTSSGHDYATIVRVYDRTGTQVYESTEKHTFLISFYRRGSLWFAHYGAEGGGEIRVLNERFEEIHRFDGNRLTEVSAGEVCFRVTRDNDASLPEAGIFPGKATHQYYNARFEPVAAPEPVPLAATRVDVIKRKHHVIINGEEMAGGPFDDSVVGAKLIWVMKRAGKQKLWGAFNQRGELIQPVQHSVCDIRRERCVVGSVGQVGLVGDNGEWIIQPRYAAMRVSWGEPERIAFYAGGKALKSGQVRGGRWGLADPSGATVVEPTFDEVGDRYSDGLLAVAVA